jgi:hypothetical protein
MKNDDLLEVYRRNKQRDAGRATKSGSLKDWGSAASSVLALMLSVFTFYITNLRKVDDFRVSIHGVLSARNNGDTFTFTSALTATFINSGTRPVALESTDLMIVQGPFTGNESIDCFKDGEVLYVDAEPVVLKPQDIAIRPLQKYKPRGARVVASDGSPVLNFADPKASVHPILICLAVTFLAPEHQQRTELIVLLAQDWQATERFAPQSAAALPFLKERPYVLLKESTFALFAK